MISILRVTGMLALALGGILLAAAGVRWWQDGPEVARMRNIPTVADRRRECAGRASDSFETTSPLLAQAGAFAAYLAPPQSPEVALDSTPMPTPPPQEVLLPAVTLKLHATSCYPDQPERSMALVSRADSPAQDQRWVKEGSQFGPFVIHEIRRGEIVYRQDDQIHQAALDHSVERRSLVRDLRHGSDRVSAAFEGAVRGLPNPAGPNDISISSD